MRIPYTSNPPSTSSDEEAAILQRVQTRRGDNGLLPLDLALLHSFPVADGWNSFLGAIRTRTSIPAAIREVAICRVAAINQAWFEWKQHYPLLKATGVSDEALELIKQDQCDESKLETLLTPRQMAVYRYSSAMTRTVKVPDEVFEQLRALFDEKEIVEITATTAAYNCVSRFLVALNVGEMNE